MTNSREDTAPIERGAINDTPPGHVKIITQYIYPPIPLRCFDWCATFDNYEEGAPIGYGETEGDAIDDLIEAAAPS